MAKIYGLNGVIRGRQGNNVFSVQNGTQVVKAYQPVVSNPRTSAQIEQRLKFSLAGKMSGATPALALSGMRGSSLREKRARFVSLVVRAASVSGSVASVDYERVLYSEGSLARYSAQATFTAEFTGAVSNSFVDVNLPAMTVNPAAPAGYGEIAVFALYDAATSTLDEVQAFVRSRTAATTIQFRQGRRRDCFVVGYVVPFNKLSRTGSLVTGSIAGTATAAQLEGSSNALLVGDEFGQSNLIAILPVLGTQANMAPNDDRGA